MPSPFPGMDPYLETPDLWPDVYHELISQIRAALNPAVRPRYVVRVELRVYISDEDDPGREALIPDVRIEKPKRQRGKKRNAGPALAVAEPLIVPFLIDDEIEEARLEIKDRETAARVTVIEVLSPTNKIRGARGRISFMQKRQEMLGSEVHWVEIDLLRGGRAVGDETAVKTQRLPHPGIARGSARQGSLLAGQCASRIARDWHSAAPSGPRCAA